MKMLNVFSAAIAAVCLSGCSGKENAPRAAPVIEAKQLSYAELPNEAVLVSVNGEKLTKAEVEKRIELRLTLTQFKRRAKVKNADMIRAQLLKTAIPQFVQETLLIDAGRKSDAHVSEDERRKLLDGIAKNYAGKRDFAQLQRSISRDERAILVAEAERQVLSNRGKESVISANYAPIGDDELPKRRAFLEEYRTRAQAASARIYGLATNFWQRLTAGETFEHLAEHVEKMNDGHIMVDDMPCDIRASHYKDDPQYYEALTKTPIGCITPPFEGDNGLMIIKKENASVAQPGQESTFSVRRVFFELPAGWDGQTDEELLADIKTLHRNEAFAKGLEKLARKAAIDYPNGTNLFRRVRKDLPGKKRLPRAVQNEIPRHVNIPE